MRRLQWTGGVILTKGGSACGDAGLTQGCGRIDLLLTHVAYRQKEAPNKVQGDGLHKDAVGSF